MRYLDEVDVDFVMILFVHVALNERSASGCWFPAVVNRVC